MLNDKSQVLHFFASKGAKTPYELFLLKRSASWDAFRQESKFLAIEALKLDKNYFFKTPVFFQEVVDKFRNPARQKELKFLTLFLAILTIVLPFSAGAAGMHLMHSLQARVISTTYLIIRTNKSFLSATYQKRLIPQQNLIDKSISYNVHAHSAC